MAVTAVLGAVSGARIPKCQKAAPASSAARPSPAISGARVLGRVPRTAAFLAANLSFTAFWDMAMLLGVNVKVVFSV
jgi:hypothetical protein